MRDFKVNSWNELVQVLYDLAKTTHQRFRSNLVYRGVADKSWRLNTSLFRLGGDYVNVEGPLLRSFRKYAEPGVLQGETIWVQLSIAQHHALPTRLLDWTLSPKVAMHFVTAEEQHYDKDGAIWCVDVAEVRALLPEAILFVLQREVAFLLSVEMLGEIVSSLADLDFLADQGSFVLFFEPPSLDARIVNQGAIMSMMPGPSLDLTEFLSNHPTLCHRVIIPKKLKWEVRDKLDQDNVTERMLFPGLDGLSSWLKRYYGPGPNRM